jgi:hypothetical protein
MKWGTGREFIVVYYKSTKRELKIRPIYECRCDERLKTKDKELKLLAYTESSTRKDLLLL